MKKAVRIYLVGNMQSMFYKQFVKQAADSHNIKGFLRILQGGKVEVFLEGESANVDSVLDILKKGPKFATVRSFEEKPEKLQDFKEFKIINF